MMRRLPEYRLNLVRELRQRSTESENHLWDYLRARRLDGLKFRRQRPLGRYIADFCCDELRLVIEIDGEYHSQEDQQEYDAIREEMLSAHGYHILHVSPEVVMQGTPEVLKRIRTFVNYTPLPLRERGRGEG